LQQVEVGEEIGRRLRRRRGKRHDCHENSEHRGAVATIAG